MIRPGTVNSPKVKLRLKEFGNNSSEAFNNSEAQIKRVWEQLI
jgi:hypothetical protein